MKREEIEQFLKSYEQTAQHIERVCQGRTTLSENNPTIYIASRIKTVDSAMNKLLKKELTLDEIDKLTDIAGVRIVVRFVQDIPKVCEMIRASGLNIVEERDYIDKVHKKSGYRAYHFIINYEGKFAEIQIRTYIMNFWAELEHSIRYKPEYPITDEIRKKLSKTSEYAHKFDEICSELYEAALEKTEDNGTMEVLEVLSGNLKYASKFIKASIYLNNIKFEMNKIRNEIIECA